MTRQSSDQRTDGTATSAVDDACVPEHPRETTGPAISPSLQQYVSLRPDVRAGEPVVRGTRVPVHLLADLSDQGASREELLEDYPAVSPEALDAALRYARLRP
jgi:uncharacterized protein (DUF433 family)